MFVICRNFRDRQRGGIVDDYNSDQVAEARDFCMQHTNPRVGLKHL